MSNMILNDLRGFHPGLINDLLLRSYKGFKGITEQDRESFEQFDKDVTEHPQWLGKYVFITTMDGNPIGFVSFDPRERPLAKIGHNCVLPEYRGDGIGKKQIEYVLKQIHSQGFEEVIVSTCDDEDFIPAQKMYLTCGFTETHRFYKDGQENNPRKKMIGYKIAFRQPGVDAFIVFENKILLTLRDNLPNIQNPNMWNLPGGGIEEGETEREALNRELKEEVNLIPRNAQYIDKTFYPDGNVVSKFLVVINAEEKNNLKLGEGQKMDFFTLDEVSNLDVIPNLRSYIKLNKEKLHKLIEGSSS